MSHQLEQLLTCCICLDRFRNPKLLPCQHSVCMEPCMEGLVDYVRRQVKCPECRAEHRIPYNGIQGFPSNVTLQRFLEAHIEITGEAPDPHTGQYMERCAVCNEKNYLSACAHCDKKVCTDCKAAHADILKREISRINNQVKRAAPRLHDQLSSVERNSASLKQNTASVIEEVENISKRLQKACRDRCDFLKAEVENYYNAELRTMTLLKEGLETEISNVDSNIDLAEKHMDDQTPWDDCELMDAKEILLRTMDFIRSFDYESGDYNRRTRFNPPDDLNKLANTLSTMGELIIIPPKQSGDSYGSGGQTLSTGLMKSKSDHRLAAQFRDQEDSAYGYASGRTSPNMRRRFGERPLATEGHDSSYEAPSESGRRRFRSRFMRREEEEERTVRFSEEELLKAQRQKVIDTEDVSRGPLSGITRMYDSPRVMKRLQEKELNSKRKKEETIKPAPTVAPKLTAASTPVQRKTARQISEDEIDKIKKQNQQDGSSSGAAAAAASTTVNSPTSSSSQPPAMPTRPPGERVSSLRDERQNRGERGSLSPRSSTTHSPTSTSFDEDYTTRREYSRPSEQASSATGSTSQRSTVQPTRKSSIDTGVTSLSQRSQPFSRSSSTSSVGETPKSSGARSPHSIDTASYERRLSRSNSTDSNKSFDGNTSPKKVSTGAAFSTDELRNRFGRTETKSKPNAYTRQNSSSAPSRYQLRFLGRPGTPAAGTSKESENDDDDDDTSDESESEDSEDSSEDEEDKEAEKASYTRSNAGLQLGRSAQSRDTSSIIKKSEKSATGTDSGYTSRYGSSSDNSSSNSSSRYGSSSASSTHGDTSYRRPSYLEGRQKKEKEEEDKFDSKYSYTSKYLNRNKTNLQEEEKPAFQSRFLNRSKSSAVIGPETGVLKKEDITQKPAMGASRARFEEMKERRQRLARSKSSAGLEDEDGGTPESNSPPASPYKSKLLKDNDMVASSASGSRTSQTSPTTTTSDDSGSTAQLSNWARYLKNKYGNKAGSGSASGTSSSTSSSSTSTRPTTRGQTSNSSTSTSSSSSTSSPRSIARSRSSHLLGLVKDGESSEDDSKNVHATPTSPAAGTQVPTPFVSLHRSQYLQKQRLLLKIGSRGSDPGNFTWPRGIAVGNNNSIVVADSSNHRVQVFDQKGKFIKEFGNYGSGEGEFDCLAGVAVNRIGQYIIADRYNHRIQVFDPSGTFLRSFGSQGSGDAKFSYPWGVTTDALGFIYVCDKENHRVQVFQSDGTFVGKFGSLGSKPGCLEHPHYIAVSSTNRVVVSDSNNHRIQVFDINGKVTASFGSEGADEGQFKFPRGVAVDDQGYIFVADSGNNRIQIFHPDGAFLRAFGCWGSEEGEFKGLEGVAVMANGNILVCDRENHRVQVF